MSKSFPSSWMNNGLCTLPLLNPAWSRKWASLSYQALRTSVWTNLGSSNPFGWVTYTSSWRIPFKNAFFTSIWNNLIWSFHAIPKSNRIDYNLATETNISSSRFPQSETIFVLLILLFSDDITIFINIILENPLIPNHIYIFRFRN